MSFSEVCRTWKDGATLTFLDDIAALSSISRSSSSTRDREAACRECKKAQGPVVLGSATAQAVDRSKQYRCKLEVSSPGNDRQKEKQGHRERWYLEVHIPEGMPRIPSAATYLPGDRIDIQVVLINGICWLVGMSGIARGTSGQDIDLHGLPESGHITFERYMLHCSKPAQDEQRCRNWIWNSDIFKLFFQDKKIQWRGTVLQRRLGCSASDSTTLSFMRLSVCIARHSSLHEVVDLDCHGALAVVAARAFDVGSTCEFVGKLRSQGGTHLHHTVEVLEFMHAHSQTQQIASPEQLAAATPPVTARSDRQHDKAEDGRQGPANCPATISQAQRELSRSIGERYTLRPSPGDGSCFFHALRLAGATDLSVADLRQLACCPGSEEAEEIHVGNVVEALHIHLTVIPAELALRPVRLNYSCSRSLGASCHPHITLVNYTSMCRGYHFDALLPKAMKL